MGAKTWMLVYSNGSVSNTFKNGTSLDKSKTISLLEKLYPTEDLVQIENGDLSYTNPPDDIIFAGCFGDVSLIAAKEFAGDYPSKIESRFIDSSLTCNAARIEILFSFSWLSVKQKVSPQSGFRPL